MRHRHRIQFPPADAHDLAQDEAFFYLIEADRKQKMRLHDYDQIYLRPGLYEQIFYDRLRCNSPQKVAEILQHACASEGKTVTELRVLDFGAGNGIMGEILKNIGVARLLGADIIPEARDATYRDRPGVYDEYYVADFTNLPQQIEEEIGEWSIDCLTSIAALGFGDIPPKAFLKALEFVRDDGWVAFNIKETFLNETDSSGFSRLIRELIFSEYLDLYHLERYRHRLSMEGLPLFYFAFVGRKTAAIPEDFLAKHGISGL